MKSLKETILEKKYDYHCIIPPFYMEMIRSALESYKNDNTRKMKHYHTDDEIDKCLNLLKMANVE